MLIYIMTNALQVLDGTDSDCDDPIDYGASDESESEEEDYDESMPREVLQNYSIVKKLTQWIYTRPNKTQ